jgi:hypothetical protein
VLGHVEEVLALQVAVELGHAAVDGGGVDVDLHPPGLAGAVELHRAFLLVEAATVGGSAEVADLEADEGVGGFDGVGGALGLRGASGQEGGGQACSGCDGMCHRDS